jgi:N-sulfoglucosamine sulfohydrolase
VGGREELFAEMTFHDYCDPRRCLRTRTHKLIVNFSSAPLFMDPSQAWRPKCTTVVPADPGTGSHPPVELYDLANDPLEHRDLAGDLAHAELLKTMLRRLHRWMVETADPLLHGIPNSPMHARAVRALQSGVVSAPAPRQSAPAQWVEWAGK